MQKNFKPINTTLANRKIVLKNLFTGQQWRNRHRYFGHGERGGEGESNMETYITICKIDGQVEFAVWFRKLKQGLFINLEWWDWEGVSNRRGYMYTYG